MNKFIELNDRLQAYLDTLTRNKRGNIFWLMIGVILLTGLVMHFGGTFFEIMAPLLLTGFLISRYSYMDRRDRADMEEDIRNILREIQPPHLRELNLLGPATMPKTYQDLRIAYVAQLKRNHPDSPISSGAKKDINDITKAYDLLKHIVEAARST